ncbi:uncharacterized protein HGUI_01491 [Hanseniaspora guilliermondii]|uniref:EF-hand domain-containing protein n=1 Tax=Hanseniaspora guilliermondii TaxID=56406 RepID=A0A1L0B2X1_9ASCO|nr:uncharacterized protein HGUI_01491 [Hanseniaspora guilliermondii]
MAFSFNLNAIKENMFRPTALASGLPIFLIILNLINFESPLETNFIAILKSLSTWNFKVGNHKFIKLLIVFLLACNYERKKGTIRFGVILNLISVFSGLPYILIGKLFALNMEVQGLNYWNVILWLGLNLEDIAMFKKIDSLQKILVIKVIGLISLLLLGYDEFNWLISLTTTTVGLVYYFSPTIFDSKLNLKSELFLKIETLKYWTHSEHPYENKNLYSLLKIIHIDYLLEREILNKQHVGSELENQSAEHSLDFDEEGLLTKEELPEFKSKLEQLQELDELDVDTFALPPLAFNENMKPRSRKSTLTKQSSFTNSPKRSRKNTLKTEFDLKNNPNSPSKKARSRSNTIGKVE